MLFELDKLNIGWAKDVRETLGSYDLPEDFDAIRASTGRQNLYARKSKWKTNSDY